MLFRENPKGAGQFKGIVDRQKEPHRHQEAAEPTAQLVELNVHIFKRHQGKDGHAAHRELIEKQDEDEGNMEHLPRRA